MSFTVRRGRERGQWQVQADLPVAGTALLVLERWVREFPHEFAEVEGIAGVFATYDPGDGAGRTLRRRTSPDRLYSRRTPPHPAPNPAAASTQTRGATHGVPDSPG